MEHKSETTCCFTGHRPDKLNGSEETVRKKLCAEIDRAIAEGIDTFISGMAAGVDLWAAELVLRKKEERPELKLICAVPFRGCEKNRSEEQQARFSAVLAGADSVEYISERYNRRCFDTRNRWMVDHSARMIAVFNGAPGGTKRTIEYAEMKGLRTVVCEDEPEAK